MRTAGDAGIFLRQMVALLCLLTGTIAQAADVEGFDLPRLMRLLAATPAGEVSFTEKKFSSLLSDPVVSSGKLVYIRPDTVEKNIDKPRKESYRFAGDKLVIVRNGVEK